MLDPFRLLKPLLVLFALVCLPSMAFAINLNGSWSYRESGSDSGEPFREIRQNYSFGVGPALTYAPSHAIRANASVGYTQTNGVSEQGSRTARTISPTAGLSLVNDLFSFRVSGNTGSSQSDGGDWSSSTNWNVLLDSAWNQPFIPKLLFSYGEYGQDSESGPVSSLKTQNKNLGVGVDWDLQRAELSYRYRNTRSASLPTSQSHFVRMKTGGRLWDDRISISFSQQAQFNSLEAPEGAPGSTVDVLVGGTVRYAISSDATPADSSCEAASVLGEDCLISAGNEIPYSSSSYVQLEIKPFSNRRIRAVEISFEEDLNSGFDSSTWSLYAYRPNSSEEWELIPGVIAAEVPDANVKRLRVEFAETDPTDREFLLVSNELAAEGKITRVDFYELLPGGAEQVSRSYQTNAGFQVRFSETLSSSLGLTYVRAESETEGDDTADFNSDKITTNGNFSWGPSPFLSASIGVSEHRERELGEEQLLNRNYSLILSSRPLPTMNVSFGTVLTERYGIELENGTVDIDQKTLETLRYSLNGKAQIYPDLTASFNLSYTAGQRWLKDEGLDTGQFVDEASRSGRIDFNAKLYKNLTVDLISRYGLSESNGASSESASSELGLRYRVSDLLVIRGSYKALIAGSSSPDSMNLRVLARVLDTDKARLDLQVGHTQAEESSEAVSLNGSWLVSKTMSLIGRGGYNFGPTNSYNLTLDLRIGI